MSELCTRVEDFKGVNKVTWRTRLLTATGASRVGARRVAVALVAAVDLDRDRARLGIGKHLHVNSLLNANVSVLSYVTPFILLSCRKPKRTIT